MCQSRSAWCRHLFFALLASCVLLSAGCVQTKGPVDRDAARRIARVRMHHASGKHFTALIGPYIDRRSPRQTLRPQFLVHTDEPQAQPMSAATAPSTEPTLDDCAVEIINGWVLVSGWHPCVRTRHVQAVGQHTTFIVEADSTGGFDRIYLLWDDIDSSPKDEVLVYDLSGNLLISFKRTSDDTAGERYVKITHSTLSVDGPHLVDHLTGSLNRRTFVNAIH